MRTIAITPPRCVAHEARVIERMLLAGIDRVHIRRPQATEAQIEELICRLPQSLYERLSLHDFHPLAVKYGLGGIHLNSRNNTPPEGFGGCISRSCHTLAEAAACREDYFFLSPVFDSISKKGYGAAFAAAELDAAKDILCNAVALGGVTPERMARLREWGFGGAAFMGYLWENADESETMRRIETILKKV